MRPALSCLQEPFDINLVIYDTFFAFWDDKYSRLILYTSCLKREIGHLSKEPWLLLVRNGI